MDNLVNVYNDEYTFEAAPEVLEKIQQADSLHKQISEDSVRDLERVNVSSRIYFVVKRVMDFVLSALGLMVLLIPMSIISVVIYLDNPGKVLFSQYRVGRYGKRFKLYKFRTMKAETPKYMATMEIDDPERYITRVGKTLRKYSLDEIPQLINVLKGDMSLVGPRPLISDEYEIHAMRMRFGVYDIRPGVTGLAQINGRDRMSPEEKVHWDVRYLREFGPWMDAKILFATMPKVFDGHDVVEGKIVCDKQDVFE